MTITEVAARFELSPDTLRYYERIGLLPTIGRTPGGVRTYTEDDCEWVDFIKSMRGAGVSVETLIEYVTLFHQGSATVPARKRLLTEQRTHLVGRIAELNAALAKLDWKINWYEEKMIAMEEKLINMLPEQD